MTFAGLRPHWRGRDVADKTRPHLCKLAWCEPRPRQNGWHIELTIGRCVFVRWDSWTVLEMISLYMASCINYTAFIMITVDVWMTTAAFFETSVCQISDDS